MLTRNRYRCSGDANKLNSSNDACYHLISSSGNKFGQPAPCVVVCLYLPGPASGCLCLPYYYVY